MQRDIADVRKNAETATACSTQMVQVRPGIVLPQQQTAAGGGMAQALSQELDMGCWQLTRFLLCLRVSAAAFKIWISFSGNSTWMRIYRRECRATTTMRKSESKSQVRELSMARPGARKSWHREAEG